VVYFFNIHLSWFSYKKINRKGHGDTQSLREPWCASWFIFLTSIFPGSLTKRLTAKATEIHKVFVSPGALGGLFFNIHPSWFSYKKINRKGHGDTQSLREPWCAWWFIF